MDPREEFHQNGYIVLREFFTKDEVKDLLEEIKVTSHYYDKPADEDTHRMHFFHNVYRRSKQLQNFCSQPRLIELFKQLIGPSFWIRWDHAVLKSAGGEEYPWHQDNAYSKVRDASFQLWVALTDADEKTGGLQFQRGSHLKGHQPHRPFSGRHIICESKVGDEVSFHAKAGDVIIFSSMILHRSEPNRSKTERWVYIVEYMNNKHYDPTIKPPYFMVAKNGRSKPQFVSMFRGKASPLNQIKYYRYNPTVQKVRHAGRQVLNALVGAPQG
jgi:ectoine hydroxylase-related dioxygenase (phytanoyl-CoA dioxygenase family)